MSPGNNGKLGGVEPALGIDEIDDTLFDRFLKRIYLLDVPTALRGGIVPNGTGFPAAPTLYQLFYRTDEGKMYFWNGSNWLQLGLLDSSSNLIIGGRYLKE